MKTPEQVAIDVIANVKKELAITGALGGYIWQKSIAEEVQKFKIEIALAVADKLKKSKVVKDKQRKAIAVELDSVFGGQ